MTPSEIRQKAEEIAFGWLCQNKHCGDVICRDMKTKLTSEIEALVLSTHNSALERAARLFDEKQDVRLLGWLQDSEEGKIIRSLKHPTGGKV